VSRESTFAENRENLADLIPPLREMLAELREDVEKSHFDRVIRSLVVKLKFADFHRTTAERAAHQIELRVFEDLVGEAWRRGENRAVRLLGVGVRFEDPQEESQQQEMEFFGDT
jgi:DNA polymerase-4